MLTTSENIDKISAALAKAAPHFGRVAADKTAKIRMKSGGEYTYDYADLGSVLDAVRGPLAEHELAITQGAKTDENNRGFMVTITTRLIHASGQWMANELSLPAVGDKPAQAIGSAITYGRRYALQAMLGLAPDKDDDGRGASGGGGRRQQPRRDDNRQARRQEPKRDNKPERRASQGDDKPILTTAQSDLGKRVATLLTGIGLDPKAEREKAKAAFVQLFGKPLTRLSDKECRAFLEALKDETPEDVRVRLEERPAPDAA